MTDEEIDAAIEKIFTEALKSPYTLENINVRCADMGNTALMLAAFSGELLLVERLLERGADPTLRNLDGVSAFIVSIRRKHEVIAKTLLPYETEQSLNTPNYIDKTALALAANFELASLEQAIIAKGGIIPGMHIKENTTPSQMRKEFLTSLQQKGPILRDGRTLPRIMLSKCFVEENDRADFPISYFDYAFLNPELRRLMILTVGACSFYKSKIFFFDFKHNEVLQFDPMAAGFFNGNTKDIVCLYKDVPSREAIISFFHEAMHLAMDFIYQNNCMPYASKDSEKKDRFETVLKKTKAKLDRLDPDFMSDSKTKEAYNSMYLAYKDEGAVELIVRIPEILVSMGIDKGMEWLRQFRELMEYYNTVVIPDMENCILQRDYYSRFMSLQCDNAKVMYTAPPSFEIIMQMICEQEDSYFILTRLEKIHKKLTLDELEQIKKAALFFKYESTVIEQCEKYFKVEQEHIRLDEIRKQEPKNRKILNRFFLDPNKEEHLRYWSSQVTGFGGYDYKGHRIPHTVANIFEVLEQTSLIDTPPGELLAEIHRLRKLDSGSKISFFPNMRSAIVEQLKTMSDDKFESSFSPGNGC